MSDTHDTMHAAGAKIPLKGVALPAEHGGWAFLLEPLLLGLLVVPSWAGLALGLAALCAFLLHQPLKVLLKDRRRGKSTPRTRWAARFAAGYAVGALALLLLALALLPAHGALFWLPLLGALPLALVQARYDALNASRAALPELAGALALAAAAPVLALAGGWTLPAALPLWGVVAARAVPAILYVRARLTLEKTGAADARPSHAAHGAALALLGAACLWAGLPPLLLASPALMLARAAWGLSRFRRPVPAKVIGFSEVAFGVAHVLLAWAAFAF